MKMDEKTIINIAAAAGKYRKELPVTYRPSVRDVCETSYSMGAKEFYPIAFKAGRSAAMTDVDAQIDLLYSKIIRDDFGSAMVAINSIREFVIKNSKR